MPLSKAEAVRLAMDKNCLAYDLIELSLHPLQELAFRSSWVLEQMFYFRTESFSLDMEKFLDAYFQQKNYSCQRHFTKIMMTLTEETKRAKYAKIEENQNQIIETTFDWLINPDTPVAVQVNCLDILLHFSAKQDWIAEELRSHIQFLLKDGSAAVQSRGKRILKKLKC